MELDEAMRRAAAELEEAEAQLRAAQDRVSELEAIRAGLRFAVERYGRAQAVAPVPALAPERAEPDSQPIQETSLGQASQCYTTLVEFGRPPSTREIFNRLTAAGYPYEFEQVRGAMGYLKKRKRVERVGTTLWKPVNGFPQTAVTGAPALNGAREES